MKLIAAYLTGTNLELAIMFVLQRNPPSRHISSDNPVLTCCEALAALTLRTILGEKALVAGAAASHA